MQYYRNLSYLPKTKGVVDRTQPVNCITDKVTIVLAPIWICVHSDCYVLVIVIVKALSIANLLSLAIALNFNFAAVTSYHRAVPKYDATVEVGYQSAKTKVQL